MSPKGIAAIVGVAVVILIVVFLPIKPNGVPPPIEDVVSVGDSFEISSETSDVLDVKDEAIMEEKTRLEYFFNDDGTKYYIDENGTKHYVLEAVDSPTLND